MERAASIGALNADPMTGITVPSVSCALRAYWVHVAKMNQPSTAQGSHETTRRPAAGDVARPNYERSQARYRALVNARSPSRASESVSLSR